MAKRSRREFFFFFAKTKNIPVTDATTPVTPVAVAGNDDGKRIPNFF